jgi:hypothetical protein
MTRYDFLYNGYAIDDLDIMLETFSTPEAAIAESCGQSGKLIKIIIEEVTLGCPNLQTDPKPTDS